MKFTAQLFAATLALTAATGAFASETDGAADNAWLKQVAISQSAPAPTATAASRDNRVVDQSNQAVTP